MTLPRLAWRAAFACLVCAGSPAHAYAPPPLPVALTALDRPALPPPFLPQYRFPEMASPSDVSAFALVRAAGFVGPATKLADLDLPRIGAAIGVGEDEMHAVIEVETRGGGHDKLKRPRILFEMHVFYRNLPEAKRSAAVAQGLAYKSWKPGNYGAESEQYPKLFRALAIDETAALAACSWGLGQILGENYKLAGYGSPHAMVSAFIAGGEAEQLAAMVRFIKAKGLDDELRRHDWAGFARGYNGEGYKANGYDLKLAVAFAKWAKIPDTPFEPELFALAKPANDAAPPAASIPPAATPGKCWLCGAARAA